MVVGRYDQYTLFKCTELSRSKKKIILKDQGIKYPKNIKLGWGC